MTPANAKALLPIIQAYAEGKTIEFQAVEGGQWHTLGDHPVYADGATCSPSFECAPSRYRIKKMPADPPMGSTDAMAWAKSFVEHVGHLSGIAADVETMVGWFANAMMATSDHIMRGRVVETACPACIGSGTDQSTIDADSGNPDGDKCQECGGSGVRPTLRVQYENEDQLPARPTGVLGVMFNASQPGTLDGVAVRMYPYVEIKGQRYYLVKLSET